MGYLIDTNVVSELRKAGAAHPHITVFPGDGVDVMPFLTGPDWNKREAEPES